jgi:hypothetical protein
MSAQACPLCGAVITAEAARCFDCGMTLAGVSPRPGPFSPRAIWWWAAALLAVYLVVLVIIVLVP